MNIDLHIERLVLDGLELGAADGPRVAAAIEAELARMLRAGGLHPALARGAALPSVAAPHEQLPSCAGAREVGGAVARSLYGGIGGRR